MLVLSISGFPPHVCRLLNDFIGLWNSYITNTWSSKSLPAHFPIKNNYGFYHHCPHTYVLQAWAHWSNHLLKIILMGKRCGHHQQFARQVGRDASSPLFWETRKSYPHFFITWPHRTLKSFPKKQVSAWRQDSWGTRLLPPLGESPSQARTHHPFPDSISLSTNWDL